MNVSGTQNGAAVSTENEGYMRNEQEKAVISRFSPQDVKSRV